MYYVRAKQERGARKMYVAGDKVRVKGHLVGVVCEYVAARCGEIGEPSEGAKVKVHHPSVKTTITYNVADVSYA